MLLPVAIAQSLVTAPIPQRPREPSADQITIRPGPRPPVAAKTWSQVTRAVLGDDGKFGSCESRAIGQPPELVLNQCAAREYMPPRVTAPYRQGLGPGPVVFVFETIQEFDDQPKLPRFSELEGFREIKREVYRITVAATGVPKCAPEIYRGAVPIYWLPPCTDGTRYLPSVDAAGKPRVVTGRITMLVTTDGKPAPAARRRR